MGNLTQHEDHPVGHLTKSKQKDFIILSVFSMCTALTGHCPYIHCFVGAFESLWKSALNGGFLEITQFYWNEQTYVRQLSETSDVEFQLCLVRYLFWKCHWWVGDLMLIVALAIGAFDHLNCQHTRDFEQNFSKKSNAQGFTQGHGWFWNWLVHNCLSIGHVWRRVGYRIVLFQKMDGAIHHINH